MLRTVLNTNTSGMDFMGKKNIEYYENLRINSEILLRYLSFLTNLEKLNYLHYSKNKLTWYLKVR